MYGGLNSYVYSVYILLILRDQLVVGNLWLIYLVAASGHNYLALVRYGGLNPLTLPACVSRSFSMSQYTLFATIHFRNTTEIWKEGTKAVFCSSIILGPVGVWTTISPDSNPSIGIIIFPIYRRSSSEAGVTVWN